MKGILVGVTVALAAVFAPLANAVTIEAGWSSPRGSFADPTREFNVAKGAESSFSFGLKFIRSMAFLDLVGELSYAEFGEQYQGPADAGTPGEYRHTFIPAAIGLRKPFLRASPVSPYIGAAVGLYGYLARGTVLVPEPGGPGYTEDSFTAVIRPGLNFSVGTIVDVPFSFDVAAELKYHLMVFQGVGDDLTDREYPYPIDTDSLTFTTFTLGLVF